MSTNRVHCDGSDIHTLISYTDRSIETNAYVGSIGKCTYCDYIEEADRVIIKGNTPGRRARNMLPLIQTMWNKSRERG